MEREREREGQAWGKNRSLEVWVHLTAMEYVSLTVREAPRAEQQGAFLNVENARGAFDWNMLVLLQDDGK